MDDGASPLLIIALLSLFMVFVNFVFVAKVFFYKGKTSPRSRQRARLSHGTEA